jgi:hypothetical protein
VANSVPDMIASFDPAKEANRLQENAQARDRALARRKARQDAVARAREDASGEAEVGSSRRADLIQKLAQIDDLLRVKNYTEAENRLRSLMVEYQQEPRVFFAMGQVASVSAQDAFDEGVQAERLGRALVNYRNAIQWASPETDKALISRSHAAIGRILAFLDKPQDAMKEFDMVIALGKVPGGAYQEAVDAKNALASPK